MLEEKEMDTEDYLKSAGGMRFRETILSDVTTFTTKRHFGIPPGGESETPLGPLTLFSFIVPTRTEKLSYKEQVQKLRSALRTQLDGGVLLDTREKGVLFPVVHFTNDRDSLKKRLSDEYVIGNDFVLHQGVYREVRSIRPESEVSTNGYHAKPQNVSYILLGFKSLDKNFSQVMIESWKDWTGARYIYMYLPDELGLVRISFYLREAPDTLNMFMYLVVVECRSVSSPERQMRLLDFAQRMRVERMSGYISVYGVSMQDK